MTGASDTETELRLTWHAILRFYERIDASGDPAESLALSLPVEASWVARLFPELSSTRHARRSRRMHRVRYRLTARTLWVILEDGVAVTVVSVPDEILAELLVYLATGLWTSDRVEPRWVPPRRSGR